MFHVLSLLAICTILSFFVFFDERLSHRTVSSGTLNLTQPTCRIVVKITYLLTYLPKDRSCDIAYCTATQVLCVVRCVIAFATRHNV